MKRKKKYYKARLRKYSIKNESMKMNKVNLDQFVSPAIQSWDQNNLIESELKKKSNFQSENLIESK
jgi:hypothetical protein